MNVPDGGVSRYKVGIASIKIYLPYDHPVCQYCWCLGYDNGLDRKFCRLTDEFILQPSRERGFECPIKFDEQVNFMSKVICIAGESGSGKTTSMRNLDPKSTYYFDCDKKASHGKAGKVNIILQIKIIKPLVMSNSSNQP